MHKVLKFKASKEDSDKISAVVHRAMKAAKKYGVDYPPLDCAMDITAAHLNGCPLDFDKLLEFDDFNFAHDVFGIRRHINRESGQLEDCFLPRCYAHEAKEAA